MKSVLLSILCMGSLVAHAQMLAPVDSAAHLNAIRIHTNLTGMKVLGAWGIANIAGGTVGYFAAKDDKWKYFHEMNAVWGLVNTGIAGLGFAGARKELDQKLMPAQMLQRYNANKKLYLINAGADVLYMGTGVLMNAHGNSTNNNAALWQGFGTSFIIQGAALFIFDNVMYHMHQRNHKKWAMTVKIG